MSYGQVNYYPPNSYVRVVAPADPFTGWTGIVDATHNDGGDMVMKVAFGDGNTAYYYADELRGVRTRRS